MARSRVNTNANVDEIIAALLGASYSKGDKNASFGDSASTIDQATADAYNDANGLTPDNSEFQTGGTQVFDKTGNNIIGGKDLDAFNSAVKGGYQDMPYKPPSYWQSLINPDTAHDVNKTNEEFALAGARGKINQTIADTAMQHASDFKNSTTHSTIIAGLKALNPDMSDADADRQATVMRMAGGTAGDSGGFDIASTLTKPETDYAYNTGTTPEGRAYAPIKDTTSHNIMADYGVQKAGGLLGGVDTENAIDDNILNTKLIASQYGLEDAPLIGRNNSFTEQLKQASNLGLDLPTETSIMRNRQTIANTQSRFGDTGSNAENLFHMMPDGKSVDRVTNPTMPPDRNKSDLIPMSMWQDPSFQELLKKHLSGQVNGNLTPSTPSSAVRLGDKYVIPYSGN